MYSPTHLKRWIEQINYTGTLFHDYYVAHWRFFRCTPMERSNHSYVKEHLLDCGAADGHVITPTFTDAVMGFRYYVMVHKDADKALRMADMFARRIRLKGSLDPENELRVDRQSIRHSWRLCGVEARIQVCRDAGVSIFAARSEILPVRYQDAIYGAMSEVER